jgi:hypothetical protein
VGSKPTAGIQGAARDETESERRELEVCEIW